MAKKLAPTTTTESQDVAPPPASLPDSLPPAVETQPSGFWSLDASASDEQIQRAVEQEVQRKVSGMAAASQYNLLVLYDDRSIDRSDANRIYRSLARVDRSRPILLVLRSRGGDVPAAYFIGKLCREHTSADFDVAIPCEAKSAATLICCGADRLHMGSLSELGPSDPQFSGMPALAVKHSLEHLAEIASRHPGAKEMLSEYLAKSLPVNIIGHFERAAGSAVQYAERLLSGRRSPMASAAHADIARRLVYDYKDHGFAIDTREAKAIFGDEMVISNSAEYELANAVFEVLDLMEWVLAHDRNRSLVFTGGLKGGCTVLQKREPNPSA